MIKVIILTLMALSVNAQVPDVISLRKEAIEQYQNKNYKQSEKLFFEVIKTDHHSFSAKTAVEYLKKILVENGTTQVALNDYEKLKNAGELKENFIPGADQFASIRALSEPGKLEEKLFSLLKMGGLLAARTTLLGMVLSNIGMSDQASYYMTQAESLAKKAQDQATKRERIKLSMRPLHYFLREPRLFPDQFQFITFREQYSDRVYQSWFTTLNFASLIHYDSDLDLSQDYVLGVSTQRSLSRQKSFGFDYSLFHRRYFYSPELSEHFLSHFITGWFSIWDQLNYELRFRYNSVITSHHHSELVGGVSELYHLTHGPQIAYAQYLSGHYLLEMAYSYKMNTDRDDVYDAPSRRSGTEHSLDTKFIYPEKNASLQPYVLYSFDRIVAEGSLFNTIRHKMGMGTVYLIGESTALDFETSIRLGVYPGSSQLDLLKSIGVNLTLPMIENIFNLVVSTGYRSQTGTLVFSRLDLGLGFNFSTSF